MKYTQRSFVYFWLFVILGVAASAWAQTDAASGVERSASVTKSTQALAYQVGGGSTKIDFEGTDLAPQASGEAKIEAKKGSTTIEAKFKSLAEPTKFGAEFLTYVLWAVSTEGSTVNLGEVQINKKGDGQLKVSNQMQVFSLILTAEPYFGVKVPSELVVLENQMRKNTKARLFPVAAYSLMERGRYQKLGNPLALSLDLKNVPLEMYQARNAVDIAKSSGAEKYAPEIFSKAEASLKMAETALARKANKRDIISTARQTVQFCEDARALSVQRQEEERLAGERRASEDAQRLAREQAEQEKLRRAKAEAEKAQALLEQEKAKRIAAEEASRRSAAEAERQRALAVEQEARKAAAEAERRRAEAERRRAEAEQRSIMAEEEKAQLRARLLKQFSMVLETRDTERGLIVNMSDVLFDTGKYTLRQEAREKLARISGILLSYPGLQIEAEGHTDTTGGEDFNRKLSQQRADSVREYLISQGIPGSSISSVGKGFSTPVASNDTAEGRQKNRRVELIVSGEVIGTQIGEIETH
jgi:outer membrane protein OmpA-like peptidoglycan-associated protein